MKRLLIERACFFEKGFTLRRYRDYPIEMRQRARKIPGRTRDPRRQKLRGGIVRALAEAGCDVSAGGFYLALGQQHGGQEMMQHGIAGSADQSLFAKLPRRIRLAGIKGRGGAASDVLGGVLVHARHIRTTQPVRKEWAGAGVY